jgi:HAD superfamily hydrolase (TIGR01549 family)
MSIDTLFLDAGGVLVHPSWTRVSAALADAGIEVSAARLAAAEPHAMRVLDEATVVGASDDRKRGWMYFNLILEQVGVELSEQTDVALGVLRDYHREQNLWEHVEADVVPALEGLRARGLRMVVVSNANGRLRHLFERLDLARWFDALLDSHEWGVEKPDPRLFQHALEASGAQAASTAHIGDLYHVDVAGARSAGLAHAVLYDAANLYPDADCPRIHRLADLTPWLNGIGGRA